MTGAALEVYFIPGLLLVIALVATGRIQLFSSDRFLNTLTIFHAIVLLAFTIWILAAASLPVYYLSERYFAIDRLSAYEIFIATTVFSLGAAYARGYVRGLLISGEIERANTRLFYGAFNLLLTVIVLGFLANNIALFWILLEL